MPPVLDCNHVCVKREASLELCEGDRDTHSLFPSDSSRQRAAPSHLLDTVRMCNPLHWDDLSVLSPPPVLGPYPAHN